MMVGMHNRFPPFLQTPWVQPPIFNLQKDFPDVSISVEGFILMRQTES